MTSLFPLWACNVCVLIACVYLLGFFWPPSKPPFAKYNLTRHFIHSLPASWARLRVSTIRPFILSSIHTRPLMYAIKPAYVAILNGRDLPFLVQLLLFVHPFLSSFLSIPLLSIPLLSFLILFFHSMMIMTIFFTPISCPATNNWSIQMSSYRCILGFRRRNVKLKIGTPGIDGRWNHLELEGGKLPYQMGSIQFSYLFVRGEKLDGVWGFLSIENDVSVCPKVWQFHQLRIWSESFVSVCVAFLNLRLNECESRAFSVSLFLDRIRPLILIYCIFLFFFSLKEC